MRPVTLGSPRDQADFYQWALRALRQIEQASNDTLINDASSSGAALATCAGATANQFAYFTDETHTAFADIGTIYGAYTATPGTITGYITVKDAGGTSRKIAVTT